MRIGIQTWGSEGDVRPFIALAAGLKARNHDVTLVITSPEMRDYSSYGTLLDIKIIHAHDSYKGFYTKFISNEELAEKTIFNKNPIKQTISIFETLFEPGADEVYQAAIRLCDANDVVIGHTAVYPLQLAAEISKRPWASVVLSPGTIASRMFPPNGLPNLGAWANNFLWGLTRAVVNRAILKFPNRLRQHGKHPSAKDMLSEIMLSGRLNLIAVSPALFSRPSDWDKSLRVCGFFEMPAVSTQWAMPSDLRQFISEGAPPVFMTFGSITSLANQRTVKLFVDAAMLSGCRAIIQSQLSAASDIPKHRDIYFVGNIPHQHVFPDCSLVVHHGGAGTSHSASLCGCPSIVVEHFADQNFNANLLKEAGLTNRILHLRSATPEILAGEIATVLANAGMKERAKSIAASMRSEDGVMKAVTMIEDEFCTESSG